MELKLLDLTNKNIKLSKYVFGCNFNSSLIHQVITTYINSGRQGTKSQKNRSEVKGSGKKPWRQKGTGKARAGSFQSPIWRSGGVTFAARNKNYVRKINKKMYKKTLKIIFSELVRKNRLIIFNKFTINYPKTKILIKKLSFFNINNALIITEFLDNNLLLAARNLYNIDVVSVFCINPVNLIKFKKVVITTNALKKIEDKLS
ncbi:50S ribosomal protein L4 [Buchnera aphidicola (Taiwanaphis decaspermi)]|uniref:50S ribosomal protein L4 n=1 Tax=Buchnera aphidicola TaxID=9 RepID=UPI0031B8B016